MARLTTLSEAAGSVPDGALLTLGGFQLNRAPMALVFELLRLKRQGLRIVTPPNPLPLDLLVGAGAAAEIEFGFLGFQYEDGFVVAPSVRRAIERGSVRWRERDVYEIVQGLRAAAFGVRFLPAPGVERSDYPRVNQTPYVADPEGDGETPVALPVGPDVALIHAQAADRRGNLYVSDLYAEDLLARAAGRVVATAEEVVERLERPTIPHTLVDVVAPVRGGAFPTSCHRHYPFSTAHLREYVALASEDRLDDYLGRYVKGTPDHAAFLAAAGWHGSWKEAFPERPRVRPAHAETAMHPADSAAPVTRTAASGRMAAPTPAHAEPQAADRLLAGMARRVADGDVVVTGVASALPMLAIALARATHAPRLTYINCVGAIDPEVRAASFTSVDVGLLDGCAATITLPDLFDLAREWRIDLMFFGAAQVDREARMNLTCIGDYVRPKVKLPGPAGSSSMRPYIRKVVIVVPRHTPRSLVERVDFATSIASPGNRETVVISDLAVLRLHDGRLALVSRHAGVTAEELGRRTGFPLEAGEAAAPTPEPTAEELSVLQRLDPGGIRHRLA
jgi:glutaconate CoA-transferase subunit A